MKATINNLQLEYEVEGPRSGLPVVCIHGFPFSKEMWKPQVEFLKKDFYVVTYDVRGHAKSDVDDGQYSIEYFVDDLIGLLDHLKLSKVILVGLSMGGYIALRAIERHPERIRALVLCDTRSEPDNNEGKVRRAMQAKAVKTDGMMQFAENFLQAVFYKKTFETNPDAVATIRKMIESTTPLGVAGTLLALAARTDSTPMLFTITVPTLILVGQHDAITPPSASHAMKEKIPDAELHVIPDAAHMSNLENSEEFNAHLLKFLKKLSKT
jgi:3-oxoadipate enol-lactonase